MTITEKIKKPYKLNPEQRKKKTERQRQLRNENRIANQKAGDKLYKKSKTYKLNPEQRKKKNERQRQRYKEQSQERMAKSLLAKWRADEREIEELKEQERWLERLREEKKKEKSLQMRNRYYKEKERVENLRQLRLGQDYKERIRKQVEEAEEAKIADCEREPRTGLDSKHKSKPKPNANAKRRDNKEHRNFEPHDREARAVPGRSKIVAKEAQAQVHGQGLDQKQKSVIPGSLWEEENWEELLNQALQADAASASAAPQDNDVPPNRAPEIQEEPCPTAAESKVPARSQLPSQLQLQLQRPPTKPKPNHTQSNLEGSNLTEAAKRSLRKLAPFNCPGNFEFEVHHHHQHQPRSKRMRKSRLQKAAITSGATTAHDGSDETKTTVQHVSTIHSKRKRNRPPQALPARKQSSASPPSSQGTSSWQRMPASDVAHKSTKKRKPSASTLKRRLLTPCNHTGMDEEQPSKELQHRTPDAIISISGAESRGNRNGSASGTTTAEDEDEAEATIETDTDIGIDIKPSAVTSASMPSTLPSTSAVSSTTPSVVPSTAAAAATMLSTSTSTILSVTPSNVPVPDMVPSTVPSAVPSAVPSSMTDRMPSAMSDIIPSAVAPLAVPDIMPSAVPSAVPSAPAAPPDGRGRRSGNHIETETTRALDNYRHIVATMKTEMDVLRDEIRALTALSRDQAATIQSMKNNS